MMRYFLMLMWPFSPESWLGLLGLAGGLRPWVPLEVFATRSEDGGLMTYE